MAAYQGEGEPKNTREAIQRILDSESPDKIEKALIELARRIDATTAQTKNVDKRTRGLRRYGGNADRSYPGPDFR